MITVEQAEKILNEYDIKPEMEVVPLMDSLNRILAQDVLSQINMPPFDKSAMDGYAISSTDRLERFKVVETIVAGSVPRKKINRGECAKIMTGAMLPHGADRVVKKEVVEEKDGFMEIKGEDANINICYQGEDIKRGDLVLKSGIRIKPAEIGIIASMGKNDICVFKKPLVGILTTGSEIIEPGGILKNGQIYNSNAFSISSQVLQTGADIKYAGVAVDNISELKKKMVENFSETDMVIISGGVSEGDYDFVPEALEGVGVELHFKRIAIKPGKPTVFGTKGKKVFFGLPGNPVSTFVIFEIFIKPFLYRMMGYTYVPFLIKGTLENDIKKKKSDRSAFIPVIYDNGSVRTVEYHGSAHLNALSEANGLLQMQAGEGELVKGATVDVRQL